MAGPFLRSADQQQAYGIGIHRRAICRSSTNTHPKANNEARQARLTRGLFYPILPILLSEFGILYNTPDSGG